MKGIDLLEVKQWYPLSYFKIENSFFSLNADTLINTWSALLVLLLVTLVARWSLTKKQSIGRYLTLAFFRNFIDLCTQAMGTFSFKHTLFITTVFVFISLCN